MNPFPRLGWAASIGLATMLLTTSANAQTLFGLDDGVGGSPNMHELDQSCSRLNNCSTALSPSIPSLLGGVAYRCGGYLWVTDGSLVCLIDQLCNNFVCCQIQGRPWSGLAYDDVREELIWTDGTQIGSMDPDPCPTVAPQGCPVPPGFRFLTGIEVDPTGGYWVCDEEGKFGKIIVDQAGRCGVRNIFQASCPGRTPTYPFTGITIDLCARPAPGVNGVAHLVDSANTIYTMTLDGNPVRCCNYPAPGGFGRKLVGLARNSVKPTTVDTGCSSGSCPSCQPRIGYTGEPVIGSPCFEVSLNAAPGQSRAVLMLGLNPINVPLFCGRLRVNPLFFFGPFGTNGTAGSCNGFARQDFVIPPDPFLCNAKLTFQWLILCRGTLDLALSDALRVLVH